MKSFRPTRIRSLRAVARAMGVIAVLSAAFACAGAGPASQPATTLTVIVKDLRNHQGQLIFGVFRSAQGFPTDARKAVDWQVVRRINGNAVTFTCRLPPGRYGASVLHDENANGKMDRNAAGVPKEGYGVTNNPKPRFRAATFSEAAFDLPPEGKSLVISVQYF